MVLGLLDLVKKVHKISLQSYLSELTTIVWRVHGGEDSAGSTKVMLPFTERSASALGAWGSAEGSSPFARSASRGVADKGLPGSSDDCALQLGDAGLIFVGASVANGGFLAIFGIFLLPALDQVERQVLLKLAVGEAHQDSVLSRKT